jgi:MEDS: MEthanogen/methylotroph, DcmR Sensory domain
MRTIGDWSSYALLRLRRRAARPPVVSPPQHLLHLYSDDEGLLDRLEVWVLAGRDRGQRTVVFATPDRREALQTRLELWSLEDAVDMYDAEAALDRFVVDGVPDPVLFESVIGSAVRAFPPGQVRAYGEMVAVLWREGNVQGALELEELWNALQRTVDCPLMCAYPDADLRTADGDHPMRASVCGAHDHLLR